MLHVVCVRTGQKYGPEYVEILRDMICRNLAAGTKGSFHCFTDQPEKLDGMLMHPIEEDLGGWWNKLLLFKEDVPWNPGDRIWYFDLDMCIVRPLDTIMAYDGPFAALRDNWPYKGCIGTAVFTWTAGELDNVWDYWNDLGRPRIAGGDQELVHRAHPEFVALQDIFPGQFVHYRQHCLLDIPKEAVVVNFHGMPKPPNVAEGWVPQVWKVGGGTALDLVCSGNTSMHALKRQIENAYTLGKPFVPIVNHVQGNDAVIVGGGPSIADLDVLPLIKLAADSGNAVFALNNTAKWLKERDIQPTYQLIADARQEMADMVLEDDVCVLLAASQCHPDVQVKADYFWHSHFDGISEFLPPTTNELADAITCQGGSSVGLLALSLAYVMGYRRFHLFGYDSCYRGDNHHAYPQPLNDDGHRIIDVDLHGNKYKAAGWMVLQAREYQDIAMKLIGQGCEITAYGRGLLQAVHNAMQTTVLAVDLRAYSILSRLNGDSPVFGAEIGVSVGNLTGKLLQGRKDLNLLLVDPYTEARSDSEWLKSGDHIAARRTQQAHEEAYGRAMSRVSLIAPDRAKFMRMTSTDAARLVDDKSLDFAFIDADHSYDAIYNDIRAWAPKVKNGGLLCGHDYDNPQFPLFGVKKAVDEWADAVKLPVDLGDDTTWFVRMP